MSQGYEGEPHAYIATQGPLPHSIVDFWHMIWNEKAPIIVMITKLKEKNKVGNSAAGKGNSAAGKLPSFS